MRVEDVLHESEGRFLSHSELSTKLGIPVTFLEPMQIRQSIPHRWRTLLSAQGQTPQTKGLYLSIAEGQPIDIVLASPAALYALLIKTLIKPIKAQAKWRITFEDPPSPVNWPNLYKAPFRATRETRLQAFQFKILHRTLPCPSYLKAIRVVPSDSCPLCSEKDTIQQNAYGSISRSGLPELTALTFQPSRPSKSSSGFCPKAVPLM